MVAVGGLSGSDFAAFVLYSQTVQGSMSSLMTQFPAVSPPHALPPPFEGGVSKGTVRLRVGLGCR